MHSTQAKPIGGQKEEASDGYTPTTTLKRQPSMSLTDNTGNPKRKRGTQETDNTGNPKRKRGTQETDNTGNPKRKRGTSL